MKKRLRRATALTVGFMAALVGLVPVAQAAPTITTPITYVHDSLGRLEAVIDPTASSNGIAVYTYDNVGNLISVQRKASSTIAIVDFWAHTGVTGSSVNIYGVNFSATASQDDVRFGSSTGPAATVTAATKTTLTVTVPTGLTVGQSYPIYVKNTATSKNITSTQTFTLTAAAGPSVSSLSATTGAPGDPITIQGFGFSTTAGANSVFFNQTRAVVTSSSATTLSVKVPPNATTGKVEVRTPDGSANSSQDFVVPGEFGVSSFDSQARIAMGGSTTVNLATQHHHALVVFPATQGQWFSLKYAPISGLSAQHQWNISVTDPLGQSVDQTLLTSTNQWATVADAMAGDYTIDVDYQCCSDGATSASIEIADLAPLIGPKHTTPTAGGATVGPLNLTAAGQWVNFTFDGTKNHRIQVGLSSTGQSGVYEDVRVYQPATPLNIAEDSSTDGSFASWTLCCVPGSNMGVLTLPETGEYSVWYHNRYNTGGSGTATFTLTDLGLGPFAPSRAALSASVNGASAGSSDTTAPWAAGQAAAQIAQARAWQASQPDTWAPTPDTEGGWTIGAEPSPYELLPALTTPDPGTTLSGRVLKINGAPVVGAAISVGATSASTDWAGRFLLGGLDPGHVAVSVDASTLEEGDFGRYEVGTDLRAHDANELGYTLWAPRIDEASGVQITSPTTHAVVITNPTMPGLKVIIPKGTSLSTDDGPVTSASITPVPLDRPPFPMPEFDAFPMHFTLQPADMYANPGGVRVVYPNLSGLPAGYRTPLWNYDPDSTGWKMYGHARVSSDGHSIVPEADVHAYSLAGISCCTTGSLPATSANCDHTSDLPGYSPGDPYTAADGASVYAPSGGAQQFVGGPTEAPGYNCAGDPVDLGNGLFNHSHTDLFESGPMAIKLTRHYRQNDSRLSGFGLAWSQTYDMRLQQGSDYPNSIDLVTGGLPVHFVNPAGVVPMQATGATGIWAGSVLQRRPFYNASGLGASQYFTGVSDDHYEVRRRDGMVFSFAQPGYLAQIRDRSGNELAIQRDAYNKITLIAAAPSGRWISFTYAGNQISSATDQAGRTVNYTYETPAAGIIRLKTVTDAIQTTQPTPKYVTYGYDSDLTLNANPSTSPSPATYLETITDNRGNPALVVRYDAQGRVDRQTLANGGQYTIAYGTDSQCSGQTKLTDPVGNITCAGVGAGGFLSSITRGVGTPDARTLTLNRGAQTNLIASVTDAFHSRQTTFGYDGVGNLTSRTEMAGTSQAVTRNYGYDLGFNRLISANIPVSATKTVTTTVGYTDGCLAVANDPCSAVITDPKGSVLTVGLSLNGQVKSRQDADGTTTYNYAHADLSSLVDPMNRTTGVFKDAAGYLAATTDPIGARTWLRHDQLGGTTGSTDPAGSTVTLVYDPNSNLLSVSQDAAAGGPSKVSWTYNAMNMPDTRTDPLGQGGASGHQDTFTYDLDANPSTWTDRKGQVQKYCFDALNRPSFVGYKATNQSPACGTSNYESTTSFQYEGGGRLWKVIDSGAGTITRGYDDLDNLTSEQTPQGTVSYAYDLANRRTAMTVTGQSAVNYTYFDNGLLKTLTRGSITASFTYNGANRPAKITLPDGLVQTYTRDASGQSTKISYDQGATNLGLISYTYDPAGRPMGAYGAWARTGLPTATTANAVYDGANRLTSWNGTALSYDNNGNLTQNGSQTYTWNARNQLTATSGGSAAFAYDGLGRRLSSTISGTTTKYLWDGANIVQEQNGSGSVTANELNGLRADQVLWRSETSGTVLSYMSDRLGSIVALANASASVTNAYTYEPYGATTVTGTTTNPFAFIGRQNDGATGLYQLRARSYSPAWGRFVSEDPIGQRGGLNLYAYGSDDPISFKDSMGLTPMGWTETYNLLQHAGFCLNGALETAPAGSVGGFAAGSVIPFLGTTIGAVVGAVGGAIIGCLVGMNSVGPGPMTGYNT